MQTRVHQLCWGSIINNYKLGLICRHRCWDPSCHLQSSHTSHAKSGLTARCISFCNQALYLHSGDYSPTRGGSSSHNIPSMSQLHCITASFDRSSKQATSKDQIFYVFSPNFIWITGLFLACVFFLWAPTRRLLCLSAVPEEKQKTWICSAHTMVNPWERNFSSILYRIGQTTASRSNSEHVWMLEQQVTF